MSPRSKFPRLTRIGVFLIIGIFASSVLLAQNKQENQYNPDPIVAKIDSKPLRISDIEDKQINDLRKQLFEILDVQLKKKAVEKLGEQHSEYANIPTFSATDDEIKSIYINNGLSAKGSYEQFYPMIKQYVLQKKEMDHIDDLYAKAVKEGLIVTYLESPNEFLVKIPVETAYLWGSKRSGIMLLEFSDYQCPFCARIQPTISTLRKRYKNKVVFGYRHSPLPFHKEADEAAIAAECARDQGKFSEYHLILFKNPKNQFNEDLKRYAKEISIKDLAKFDQCLDKEEYRPRLNRDMEVANEAGIKGTPGFVIGLYDEKKGIVSGEIISGAQPQDVFVYTIEKYLDKLN